MLLNLDIFVGRWHPLIVHLPIGFLLLGILLLAMSRNAKFMAVKAAVPVCFLAGCLAAIAACITGYLLAQSGDYAGDILDQHMLAGFLTAGLSFVCWAATSSLPQVQKWRLYRYRFIPAIILLLSIGITGHLGGTLTHGEDYLWAGQPGSITGKRGASDYSQALVFKEVIQPILNDKCGSCHNNTRKKGRLSVKNYEQLLKGGKHGVVVKAGDARNSELIRRVMLRPSDKKFMPANNKPALTENERSILIWWIGAGAQKEDKRIAELKLPEETRALFQAYFTNGEEDPKNEDEEEGVVAVQLAGQMPAPVSPGQLNALKTQGFQVRLIHQNPDLLDVRLFRAAANNSGASVLDQLLAVKKNILWLDLSAAGITDKDLAGLPAFENLRRLNLRGNAVTDKGVSALAGLKFLQSINLAETSITNASLASLQLPALKTVYVWKTGYRQPLAGEEKKYAFNIINGTYDPLHLKN